LCLQKHRNEEGNQEGRIEIKRQNKESKMEETNKRQINVVREEERENENLNHRKEKQ
jgi:hypothetical protein